MQTSPLSLPVPLSLACHVPTATSSLSRSPAPSSHHPPPLYSLPFSLLCAVPFLYLALPPFLSPFIEPYQKKSQMRTNTEVKFAYNFDNSSTPRGPSKVEAIDDTSEPVMQKLAEQGNDRKYQSNMKDNSNLGASWKKQKTVKFQKLRFKKIRSLTPILRNRGIL
jgi:hypothetical protein